MPPPARGCPSLRGRGSPVYQFVGFLVYSFDFQMLDLVG